MDEILKISYEKYQLSNGLQVILYPEYSVPIIAVNLWYKVGSAYESKGKTGFAHLFEHMMFQGSKHVPKQMHFKYIQEAGGSLNGSTSMDRTNYYQSVPTNYLELVLWLESDRMGFLMPALNQEKLENQIDVVKNERRQRYDNAPYGLAWEKLFSNLYPDNHPYHSPTIGWMEDISNMTMDEVRSFFHKYYIPNNASLVIGGDININKTKDLVDAYFGSIPVGKEIEQIVAPLFELKENKLILHEDNITLPKLYFAWHAFRSFDKNEPASDILAHLLSSTKNSRLFKSMVFEKEIAQSTASFIHSGKSDGAFIIMATARPNVSLSVLKEEIFIQLNKISNEGITPEELQRTKNNIKAEFIYSMQNINVLTDRINEYNFYMNEPDSFLFDLQRYQEVTVEEIRQSAQFYLNNFYVELQIVPKQNSEVY